MKKNKEACPTVQKSIDKEGISADHYLQLMTTAYTQLIALMATYTLITTCYTQLMTIAYTQLLKSALMTIAYSKNHYLTVIFNAIRSIDHILKILIPR